MKGTLLGGFKIWLQDGNGNPLSGPRGRVKFYKAGTLAGSSEPLEVYSSAAMDTALGTVVYSNAKGYLPDVWLRTDQLYDIRVEKKMQDDPESWVTEYDVYNVGEVIDEFVSTWNQNSIFVNSIDELKALDYHTYSFAYVAGYYSPGDWGSPSVFRYEANNMRSPDGGEVILPNGITVQSKGRWVQQLDDSVVDVRKFGAIPDMAEVPDVTSQISNCATYCLSALLHKRPVSMGFVKAGNYYVSGNLDLSQYVFHEQGGSTYQLHVEIVGGVVFYGSLSTGSVVTLGVNTSVRSENAIIGGYATLEVQEGSKGVDPAWWGRRPCSVYDSEVVSMQPHRGNVYFNNCVISAVDSFSGVTEFHDCLVRGEFFADGYDFDNKASFYDCTFAPCKEWSDKNAWVKCKLNNGDTEFDFDGTDVGNVSISSDETIYVRNAKSLAGNFDAQSMIFHNVESLSIGNTITHSNYAIAIDNCLVSGNFSNLGTGSISLKNSAINGKLTTSSSMYLYNCTIDNSIQCKSLVMNGCNALSGSVTVIDNTSCLVENCVLVELVAKGASVFNCTIASFKDNVVSAVSSSTSSWCSVIRNSFISSLETNTVSTSSTCNVQWSNSRINSVTFNKCLVTGSSYDVTDCYVKDSAGNKYEREICRYFTAASTFGMYPSQSSSQSVSMTKSLITGLFTFLDLQDASYGDEGDAVNLEVAGIEVGGVVTWMRSDGIDKSVAMTNKSRVVKLGTSYWIVIGYNSASEPANLTTVYVDAKVKDQ